MRYKYIFAKCYKRVLKEKRENAKTIMRKALKKVIKGKNAINVY